MWVLKDCFRDELVIFEGFLRLVRWKAVGGGFGYGIWEDRQMGLKGLKDLKGFGEEGLAFFVNYLAFYF